MLRIRFTIVLLAALALLANCQVALAAGAFVLPDCPFVICSEIDDTTEVKLTDEQFNSMAASLRFEVNTTNFDTTQEFFRIFNDSVISYLRHQHFQIEKLFVRGAASPEGSYSNNRRLGQGRAARLFELIKSDLYAPDAPMPKMESQTIVEDYGYLVELMEAAGDPDAQRVREMFESAGWNEPLCKQLLRKADYGHLWKRLLNEYFPTLRSARVVIWVKRYRPAPESPIETPIAALPVDTLSPIEALVGKTATLPGYPYYRRPVVAIRTNLIRDFFYMPKFGWAPSLDVQLEFFPHYSHYTANMAFTWSNHRHWDTQEFFQVRDGQLEVRRYFRSPGEYYGFFLGAYAQFAKYGIGLDAETGWQGEAWGAGLDIGYSLRLTPKGHLRLEFAMKLGYLGSVFDRYVYGNPVTGETDGLYYYDFIGNADDFRKRNTLLTWGGPTDLSIALTYDIIYSARQHAVHRRAGTLKNDIRTF